MTWKAFGFGGILKVLYQDIVRIFWDSSVMNGIHLTCLLDTYLWYSSAVIVPCQFQNSQTTSPGCQACRRPKRHEKNPSCVEMSLNYLIFKDSQLLSHPFLHQTSGHSHMEWIGDEMDSGLSSEVVQDTAWLVMIINIDM